MTTNYFVMTKKHDNIQNNEENKIIQFSENKIYILPHNNINYYRQHGLFESSLIEWCKQFCDKNKIFLDIGAHSGTYTISLASLCKEVYSFEPQKMTYYSLCGSVALSNLQNVTCCQFGLGSDEQRGKQLLNIVSNDGGGSTLHSRNNIISSTEVEIKTLDELNLSNISFIKMDVEDNEYYVLLGSKYTLIRNNYPTIIFELNDVEIGKKTCDLLISYGYKIHAINGYSNMFLASIN